MSGQERVVIDTRDGVVVARKRCREPAEMTRQRHEIEVLTRLDHPGVVRFLDSSDEDGEIELVTKWVGQHSLATSPPLPTDRLAATIAALADTLADLHADGVVHNRVERSHVLLGPDGPVLCGFGDADLLDGPARTTARVTGDVCAVGRLLGGLLEPTDDLEPIPDRRLPRPGTRRWDGYRRRALLTLADQATADDPARRPSMRGLAEAIREAAGPQESPSDAASALATWVGLHRLGLVVGVAAVVLVVTGAALGVGRLSRSPSETAAATPACPPGAIGDVDLDGDGCGESVIPAADGTVRTPDATYEVALPGDTLVIGDWDCDRIDTPAVFRPSTRQIFVYPRWASAGTPVPADEVPSPASTRTIEAARRGSCDELVAIGPHDSRTTVDTEGS